MFEFKTPEYTYEPRLVSDGVPDDPPVDRITENDYQPGFEPMKQLDVKYIPFPNEAFVSEMPKIFYGLAVTPFQFRAYAKKRDLRLSADHSQKAADQRWGLARSVIISHLTRKFKYPFTGGVVALNRPIGIIALFSNRTMDWYYRDGIKEKVLMNAIREELDLAQDAEAMWYYSLEDLDDLQECISLPKRPNRPPLCMPQKSKKKARKSKEIQGTASSSIKEAEFTQDLELTPTMVNALLSESHQLEI